MSRIRYDDRFVDHMNKNPNMSNHFWGQRLEREKNHKFEYGLLRLTMLFIGLLLKDLN